MPLRPGDAADAVAVAAEQSEDTPLSVVADGESVAAVAAWSQGRQAPGAGSAAPSLPVDAPAAGSAVDVPAAESAVDAPAAENAVDDFAAAAAAKSEGTSLGNHAVAVATAVESSSASDTTLVRTTFP